MNYSYNKGIEMVDGLIKAGTVKGWQHDEEGTKEYFKIGKETKKEDLLELSKKIAQEDPNSAELYLGNLITATIVNPPSKTGAPGFQKERVFVSDEQKAHWDFSRLVLIKVNDFLKNDPDCIKLKSMTRKVNDEKKGKQVTVFIEPKVHMRQADAVMASYPASEGEGQSRQQELAPEPESIETEPTDEQLSNVEEELENA